MSERPRVLIVLPQRPGENMANGLWVATQPGAMGEGFDIVQLYAQPCSLLNNNFNDLWCQMLNRRKAENITHFIMVHSDVCPEPGKWIQTLLEEQKRVDADVLSCVIALKDHTGMSSTGIMHWPTEKIKKLSVDQCLKLPKPFDAKQCIIEGHGIGTTKLYSADYCLLMNSGCWVADVRGDWVEKMCFRSYDTIVKYEEDGQTKWKAISTGEDWLFSMDCYRLGLRTFATTAVGVKHQGIFQYPNSVAYGSKQGEDIWGNPWCIQAPPSWTAEESQTIKPRRPSKILTNAGITPPNGGDVGSYGTSPSPPVSVDG